MNKRSSAWVVGSSITHHGNQEESQSPMQWVTGRQTLILLWNQQELANWSQPLSTSARKTRRVLTWVDTHRWERLCRSPAFLRRDSSIPLEEKEKNTSLDELERVRETLPPHYFPWYLSTALDWTSWWRPHLNEKETSEWVPGYPRCAGNWAEEAHFYPQHPEYWCRTSRTGGREIKKEADTNIKGH